MIIKDVHARIIKDSRKEDTIEVEIVTEKGKFIASAPSGKSKGKHESKDFSVNGINFSLQFIQSVGKNLLLNCCNLRILKICRSLKRLLERLTKLQIGA